MRRGVYELSVKICGVDIPKLQDFKKLLYLSPKALVGTLIKIKAHAMALYNVHPISQFIL